MAAGWCLARLDKKRSRNEFQELQAHAEESLARNGVCGGSVNMLGGSGFRKTEIELIPADTIYL